jgi:hypothetical protein
MKFTRPLTTAIALIATLTGHAALAQSTAPTPTGAISLQLNSADLVGEACRITFVVTNQSQAPVDKAIYETVLFSTEGGVLMLTLFDFGQLPVNVPRVRQFQIADTSCAKIGSVLINGANTCQVDGNDATLCSDALKTSSRLDIKLQG